MTVTFVYFESELEKIANWKLRAAEAALGAAPGAAIGYGMAKGEGAPGEVERQAALAGGIIGAGVGLSGSAVVRALRGMSEAEIAVPKAIKAGKEALKKPTTEHESALAAIKAAGWHEKPPREAVAPNAADLIAARADHTRLSQYAWKLSQRGRSAHEVGVATQAAQEAADLVRQMEGQGKAARDWGAYQPLDTNLKKSKAALDAAIKEHGEKGIRQSVTDTSHEKYDKKLFGLL